MAMRFDVLPRGVVALRVSAFGGGRWSRRCWKERVRGAAFTTCSGRTCGVSTDEFALWDEPLEWWPRLLAQVAGRREWSRHLAYTVFIATPEQSRLRRGHERDGKHRLDQWRSWMAAEAHHFARDGVLDRADVVVDGEPSLATTLRNSSSCHATGPTDPAHSRCIPDLLRSSRHRGRALRLVLLRKERAEHQCGSVPGLLRVSSAGCGKKPRMSES